MSIIGKDLELHKALHELNTVHNRAEPQTKEKPKPLKGIIFSWMWPALVTGNKTMIRQTWSDEFAHSIAENEILLLWIKSVRRAALT